MTVQPVLYYYVYKEQREKKLALNAAIKECILSSADQSNRRIIEKIVMRSYREKMIKLKVCNQFSF